MKKQYATLFVRDNEYVLKDEKGKTILSGELPKCHYMYEKVIVFNILSAEGWNFELALKTDGWYMMSKEVSK
jgi:hypothetical protein